MALTRARLWTAGGLAACVLAAFAGWTFIVAPQRDKAAAHWLELDAAETQTTSLHARNTALEQQFLQIDSARATLAAKKLSLPSSNGLDSLVRSLDEIAAEVGVTVEEVTAGDPVDMSTLAGTSPVAAEPSGAESSEGATTDDTAAGTDLSTPAARVVYVIPVTIRVSGPLPDLQTFLERAQTAQPRAILITTVSIVPNQEVKALADGATLLMETGVFSSPESAPTSTATPTPTG